MTTFAFEESKLWNTLSSNTAIAIYAVLFIVIAIVLYFTLGRSTTVVDESSGGTNTTAPVTTAAPTTTAPTTAAPVTTAPGGTVLIKELFKNTDIDWMNMKTGTYSSHDILTINESLPSVTLEFKTDFENKTLDFENIPDVFSVLDITFNNAPPSQWENLSLSSVPLSEFNLTFNQSPKTFPIMQAKIDFNLTFNQDPISYPDPPGFTLGESADSWTFTFKTPPKSTWQKIPLYQVPTPSEKRPGLYLDFTQLDNFTSADVQNATDLCSNIIGTTDDMDIAIKIQVPPGTYTTPPGWLCCDSNKWVELYYSKDSTICAGGVCGELSE